MAENTDKKTPRDLLRVVFRRRWLFLLSASLFAIIALQVAQRLLPLKYTGTAKFQRHSDAASEEALGRGSGSFESVKSTLEYELAGREAVKSVAHAEGLTLGLPRHANGQLTTAGRIREQQIVKRLQQAVKLRWDVKSRDVDLVSVSVEHEDPDLAQKIPDALTKRYIERTSARIVTRLTDSKKFLKGQVDTRYSLVTELKRQRFDFEVKNAEMMPDRPGELKERLQDVISNLKDLRRQQTIAKQTIARLNAPSEPEPTTTPATQPAEKPLQTIMGLNPKFRRLEDELRDYERRLDMARSLSHMTDAHPTVKTLKAKIVELKKRVESTPEKIVLQEIYGSASSTGGANANGTQAAAKSVLDITTLEIERLEARRPVLLRLVNSFAPVRQQYEEILENIDREETELQSWQGRLTEVNMALVAEVAKRRTHLNAVQLAEKQLLPSSPKLMMVLGFAIFGGLAVGGGLVFLFNMLDRSIARTEEAAECFSLPVLGTVGEIITGRQLRWGRLKRWIITPVVTIVVLAALSLSSLGVVLWLQHPDEYEKWSNSPGVWLRQNVGEKARSVIETIKNF